MGYIKGHEEANRNNIRKLNKILNFVRDLISQYTVGSKLPQDLD
jgi:hypothetical protein